MKCNVSTRYSWQMVMMILVIGLLGACDGAYKAKPRDTPVITVQPTDVSVVAGHAASFNVTATGTALSYQWQSSADDGTSWRDIAGATASTYNLATTDLSDSGRLFRVLVSAAGVTVASSSARLGVAMTVEAPTIIVQPVSEAVVAPATATFSVTASGTSLQYQWQLSSDGGGNWNDIDAQTTASYTSPATEAGFSGVQLRVRVSNSAGSVISNAVVLTIYVEGAVIGPPFFSEQPQDQSVIVGSSASFFATVSGAPEATLQWQRSNDAGAHWADIAGATSNSYSTPATVDGDDGAQFRLVAVNDKGSANSNVVTLTVAPSAVPVFTVQPQSSSVLASVSVTLTADADGTPTPSYQWQVSQDGGAHWSNMNGATGTSYETPPANRDSNITSYRVVASNSAGTAYSDPAKVQMDCPVVLTFSNPGGGGHQLMFLSENHSTFCPSQYQDSIDPDTGIRSIQFKDVSGVTNGWTLLVRYRAASQGQAQFIQLIYLHPYLDSFGFGSVVFSCADESCAGVNIDLDNHLITFNNAALAGPVTGDGDAGMVSWDGVLGFP